MNTKITINHDLTSASLLSALNHEKTRLIDAGKLRAIKDKVIGKITPIFDIPNNWTWVKLSEISIIQEGPGIRKHQYQTEGIQFLTVTNILDGSVDLKKSQKYISFDEYNTKYRHFELNKGDVVIACSGGSWGKSAVYDHDEKLILNTSTLRLRFFGDLGDNKYLYYLTKSDFFNKQIEVQLSGQQPNFGYSHYSLVSMPLPPLSEQKRIVAILDQIFSDIEQARAKTEQNLKNARELLESYLQQVFSQRGDGWVISCLGDLADINYGYTEKASFESVGPHFLRITDIQDGIVNWDTVPHCPISEDDYIKHKLMSGDIVFARTGATTGKSYLLSNPPDSVAASYLIRLRLKVLGIVPEFVRYFFQTKDYWDVVLAGMSGSAQGGFNASKLSEMNISYPSCLREQKILIDEFKNIAKRTDELKLIYTNKLSALDELKKSILQKAFTGQLTNKKSKGAAA